MDLLGSVLLVLCLVVAEKRGFILLREKDPTPLMEREELLPAEEAESTEEKTQGEERDHTETDESDSQGS